MKKMYLLLGSALVPAFSTACGTTTNQHATPTLAVAGPQRLTPVKDSPDSEGAVCGATTAPAAGGAAPSGAPCPSYLATKTPYQPQQDMATYEPPPAGFAPVFTQIVARHGSRGLSSFEDDALTYAMWQRAQADAALTPLGERLGPDVLRIIRANALLGSGVAGISTPGYGNLTQVGMQEHRQLAARLLERLPGYFSELGATATTSKRAIVVVSSGVDRAVDSAEFFSDALITGNPALGSLITRPPAPAGYPAGAPMEQPAGTNRFLLYFHKLNPKVDLVLDSADANYGVYQSSLLYQAHEDDPAINAKIDDIKAEPSVLAASRQVLERLFSKSFVDAIEAGAVSFGNTETLEVASDDGAYTTQISGDGEAKVASLTDAALALYGLYAIAPALRLETGGLDFTPYIPAVDAQRFAFLEDADDFYTKGPSTLEASQSVYGMAQVLLDDFFSEVDAVVAGDLSHGAKLRFTHAEIIIPFTSILGLAGVFEPVPSTDVYTYDTNPWRGADASPMAANVQWDVYRDAQGSVLVKMLRNEKEADFKPACAGARVASESFYYDYAQLKACYGRKIP